MMEETELEEGEAFLGYPDGDGDGDGDGDYNIDPDIAFSYIGEKVQRYLGHHQKDFEGAKFNGYGTFLPTYQRSALSSQINSPARADNCNFTRSSRKHISEDQSSHDASRNIQSNHVEEPIVKGEAIVESVNPSEHRVLKVQVKVGSENSSTQKNADLYSGLGLDVSPSSSLDGSPTTGAEKCCKNFWREPDESPTSILEVMTSVPEELPMSPLPQHLIYLTEKGNFGTKRGIKNADKTGIESFSVELKSRKSNSNKEHNASLLEKVTEINDFESEGLVTNALRLPFLSGSQRSTVDAAEELPVITTPLNKAEKSYDLDYLQSISSVGGKVRKASRGTKSSKQLLKSGSINEDLKPVREKSLTGGKMKRKVDQAVRTQGVSVGKDESIIKSSLPQKGDISYHTNDSLINTDPISSSGQHHTNSGNHEDSEEKEPSRGETNVGTNSKSEERKSGHVNLESENNRDKKNILKLDSAKLSIHPSRKSTGFPPSAGGQTESVANPQPGSGFWKENGLKSASIDGCDNGDMPKAQNQRMRTENQNGQIHPTPNSQKPRDGEVPSPLRRDSFSHAANNALKEAKDLKHMADRFKDSRSAERTGIYFQSALKFLHGASLLESGCSEASKHGGLSQAMQIYSSTGKLCEFCAREYEKSKDMAAAALAYKCMEVSYLRVVYSSQTSASRDRAELQAALQIAPSGDSPSSSVSDIDNHQAITDKAALANALGSPQDSGTHVNTLRNRSGLSNIINYAQDANSAMEASRKSRIAFTAAKSRCGEIPNGDGMSLLERALDFNFLDVEGFLRLVRVAMEAIGR